MYLALRSFARLRDLLIVANIQGVQQLRVEATSSENRTLDDMALREGAHAHLVEESPKKEEPLVRQGKVMVDDPNSHLNELSGSHKSGGHQLSSDSEELMDENGELFSLKNSGVTAAPWGEIPASAHRSVCSLVKQSDLQDQSGLQTHSPKVAMGILPENKSIRRDLHLLCIGRDTPALSALITLKEVLQLYQYAQNLSQLPRPCDVFDLAGGMGIGGVIVIMLFRLGMTVDEAITMVSEEVFSNITVWRHEETNTSRLKDALANFNRNADKGQALEMSMLDDGPKCFVIASTARTVFRTYMPTRYNCTIMEAIRETTAEPFFPGIHVGDANVKETPIPGGSNDLANAAIEEALLISPGHGISCMVSIGDGPQSMIGFESISAAQLARVPREVLSDDEDKEGFYCQLKAHHLLGEIDFYGEELRDVRIHMQKYLENYDIRNVRRLVLVLSQRKAIASTVEKTLRVLGNFLDSLISMSPGAGESWSKVISEFIRVCEPSKVETETLFIQCALLRGILGSRLHLHGKELSELKDDIQQFLEELKMMFQDSMKTREGAITYINTNISKLLQRSGARQPNPRNGMKHNFRKYIPNIDLMKATFSQLEPIQGVSHQLLSDPQYTTFMDSFFTQILLAAVPADDDDWFGRYQMVVGTIIALQYPLPWVTLSAFLNFNFHDVLRSCLVSRAA